MACESDFWLKFQLSQSFREIVCNSVCLDWTGGISLVCQQVKLGNILLEIFQLLWADCLLHWDRMLRDTNRCPATFPDLSGSQELYEKIHKLIHT